MDNEHAVHALIRKRAEIAGRLEYHLAEARKAEDDLASVDHTLALFAAGIKPREIKPKRFRPDAKPRGEVMRYILDALRMAKAPMTSAELAAVVLERRGLATALPRTKISIVNRTRAALCDFRGSGLVVSEKGESGLLTWRLR